MPRELAHAEAPREEATVVLVALEVDQKRAFDVGLRELLDDPHVGNRDDESTATGPVLRLLGEDLLSKFQVRSSG